MSIGRVYRVNVSPGGVPKLPVPRTWVGRDGLDGDRHNEPLTLHGGLERAVCLYSVEQIERVRADGHPLAGPGALGENLTLEGIDLGGLGPGSRLAVGDGGLVLEIASYVSPCQTIAHNFRDRGIARISPKTNLQDSRRYARVVIEGPVAEGDRVEVVGSTRAAQPGSGAAAGAGAAQAGAAQDRAAQARASARNATPPPVV